MAYLHVLREASALLDAGARYSHRGAIGHLGGVRAAIRLVYLDRALGDGPPEPWYTRVELALPNAPLGFVCDEAHGEGAASARASFADEGIDRAWFDVRFRVTAPPAEPTPFPSDALRERMLRHPPFTARVAAEVEIHEGADPYGTTDGADARAHLAGAPILTVDTPGICESTDLEHLVALATHLHAELR